MSESLPPDPVAPRLSRANLQDRAIRGAAWTVVHTFVSLPVAFGVNLVVARRLGSGGYGRLAFLTAVMEIATGVVALGLSSGLVQFGAKSHAGGRPGSVRRMLSAAQGFQLMVAAPLLTVLVVTIANVSPVLLVLAVVFGVWLRAALAGAGTCLQIENKTASEAKIAMVTSLLIQLTVLTVALTIGTPDAVWAAQLTAGSVLAVLALGLIAPDYRRAVLRPTLPVGFPPGFWRFAIPSGIAALVSTLVVSRTEVVFLTWLSTASTVGIFALAYGLASHLMAPAQALMGPLIPAISGLREVDEKAVAPAFERTLRAGATIVGLICSSALPPLAILIPVLYGAEYRPSAPLTLVLGLSAGFLVAAGPVSAFVLARLSAGRLLAANVVALVVDVALAIALIPTLGAWGAVIANATGSATRLVLLLRTEIHQLGITWLMTVRQLLPLVLGGVSCGLGWLVGTTISAHPVGLAVVAAAAGTAVYLVSLRVSRSGLAPGDISAILRTLPPRLRRVAGPAIRLLALPERQI